MMRKTFILSAFSTIGILFASSCKSKDNGNSASSANSDTYNSTQKESYEERVINPADLFTLDYTPYEPEPEIPYGRLNLSTKAAADSKEISSGQKNISNCLIKYSTKKEEPENETLPQDSGVKNSSESLEIADWGPQPRIPAEVHNPSFYILFSEPMVAISELGKDSDRSQYMSITPYIPGVFRWNGTRLLSYECSAAADPLVEYTINVPANLKSLTGESLKTQKTFKVKSAPLAIKWNKAGYSKGYVSQDNVPPALASEWRVCFNYPVDAKKLEDLSEISIYPEVAGANTKVGFTIEQNSIDTVTYKIAKDIPCNCTVELNVMNPDGEKSASAQFHTLKPFKYTRHSTEYTYGKKTNPVCIYFNQPVEKGSVVNAISTTPRMQITKDNVEVNGSSVCLFGLPVTFGAKYRININRKLNDIYGQPVSEEASFDITVPNARAGAYFTNYGAKMLEAQFPHRLVFEYQNAIKPAYYSLQTTRSPLTDCHYNDNFNISNYDKKVELPVMPKNERLIKALDFDEYLTNGRGAVRFDAKITFPKSPTEWDKETAYTMTNTSTVQVTDLGLTTRFAANKILVLVSSLSTGLPIKGAKVYAFNTDEDEVYKETSRYSATTNDNGLAEITVPVKEVHSLFGEYGEVTIAANYKNGDCDDWAVYEPNSHYPWRADVAVDSLSQAYNKIQRTFMFTDRGLYKPGETLSFRGIDRTQLPGSFAPFTGPYTVELESSNWDDDTVYAKIEENTSESGGFYGSIVLPEDIKPGIYNLIYRRQGNKDNSNQITQINIAYFERVKFQAQVAMPSTPVCLGENIQANISASYLAGGALASAAVDSSWFREPTVFTSSNKELKDYTFGPNDISENRIQIRSDNTKLNASGQAKMLCQTSGSDIKGAPYTYRVNADITDLSNQQIGTTGSVMVHPASYYVGISKPQGVSSFPQINENITFKYTLCNLEGYPIADKKDLAFIAGKDKKITVTLNREEWNLVQQAGTSADIYSRYEKSVVKESENEISLDINGAFNITAKKPGRHIVRVSAKDLLGRDVVSEYAFYATGSAASSWYQEDSDSIELTPDKNMYKPGETAKILMQSQLPKGDYLITVEREGIFTQEVRHFDSGVQVLEVPIARNYLPAVYVSVASYSVRSGQPKNEYGTIDLDKPKGYYGVTPLFVNPRIKTFTVDISPTKKAYNPGEDVEVTLTATKGGKPLADAELTLLAVDRGVLDLINYHVPNPVEFFYNTYNFPLRVSGGDSRALLMDPVTYQVKNLMGGDAYSDGNEKGYECAAMAKGESLSERNNFNPTAVFEPVLKTGKDGKVTVKFKLPDSLTTYRITAFGVHGELLSLHEDEIAVQNPINAQQVLPRRLRERDTAELGLLLTNLDGKKHDMEISLRLEKPEVIEENDGLVQSAGFAKVDGKDSHKFTVEAAQNAIVYFTAAALKAGLVNAVFTIKSDVLNERLVCPLTIERPYIYETFTTAGQLSQKENNTVEQIVLPKADDDKGSLTITLDATRLGLLGGAVDYVFNYPYGCMEQQTAKLLPLIIFEKYIDVFDLSNNVGNIRKCVKTFLKNWKNYQHADGGFGYWPDSYKSDTYVSLRIAHIAATALKHGYSEKEISFDCNRLLSFLEKDIPGKGLYMRAYYYYVLSLFGHAISTTQLESIYNDGSASISDLAFTALAALNKEKEDKALAKKCADKIKSFIRPTSRGADISSPDSSKWAGLYYNDNSEMLALALQVFNALTPDDELNTRIIYSLLQAQRAGFWKNTSTTVRVLESIASVIESNNLKATDLNAVATLDGKTLAETSFKGINARPLTSKFEFTDSSLSTLPKNKMIPLAIEKKGKGALYYTASLRYAIPSEKQTARDYGLGTLFTLYDNSTGEEIKAKEGSNIIELEGGKTYKVKINLSSTYDRSYIALRAPVPSGAEILDATFATNPSEAENESGQGRYSEDSENFDSYYGGDHYMSNQEIYDNEVQFFWDYFAKGKTLAEFKFRAVRRGVYPTPPVTAECMYEPEVFGRTGGLLYIIK